MREGTVFIAFTERGLALAGKLSAALGGTVTSGRSRAFSLKDWTEESFRTREALVFIGAAGIAVRAVAPFVKSKAEDPAVVVVDELGRFAIPVLSGHLGGANALAQRIALACGAVAVITTATDINGAFAVDLWAKRQGLKLMEPERIKQVSSKILAGERVRVSCQWPVLGEAPENIGLDSVGDVVVDVRYHGGKALHLVPRIMTLGIGCRRGANREQIETVFAGFCAERNIIPEGICQAASIDRKSDEAGLLAFCEGHGWPLRFYAAGELAAVAGEFSSSGFVKATVGVDNVCERSAVLSSGGTLFEKKYAAEGVTLALAIVQPTLDWSF